MPEKVAQDPAAHDVNTSGSTEDTRAATALDAVRRAMDAIGEFQDSLLEIGTDELADATTALDEFQLAKFLDRFGDMWSVIAEVMSEMGKRGNQLVGKPDIAEVATGLDRVIYSLLYEVSVLDPDDRRHELPDD
jgi:hypothetical protein